MKKWLFLFIMIIIVSVSYAQEIETIVTEKIEVKRMYNVIYTFALGDTVTIHAYKKSNDKYYYLVECNDYADIIDCKNIPFNVTEKQLKKLPNALTAEVTWQKEKLQNLVESRKKETCKKKAFLGEYRTTIASDHFLTPIYGTDCKLNRGDVVYIIGYKSGYLEYQYAMYSTEFAGIFKSSSNYLLFDDDINTKYLPSVEDVDVQRFLTDKQQEIAGRQAEEKKSFREKALKGEVKGILSFAVPEPTDNKSNHFKTNDTVTIVGYTKIGSMNFYTLYSDSNYGVFRSSSPLSSTFQNAGEIDFKKLPDYDDPEVKLLIQKQSVIVDSVMQIRLAEAERNLAESQIRLIEKYKMLSPFIISDITWDTNSAGGIKVSMTITNCSQQTIKYVTFQGYFKNAVGDKCQNEIGGGTIWRARGVGPIGPCPSSIENCRERMYDCKGSYDFDNLTFYSRVAETFKLSSVSIQYMNGKTITLSGPNLDKHVIY